MDFHIKIVIKYGELHNKIVRDLTNFMPYYTINFANCQPRTPRFEPFLSFFLHFFITFLTKSQQQNRPHAIQRIDNFAVGYANVTKVLFQFDDRHAAIAFPVLTEAEGG